MDAKGFIGSMGLQELLDSFYFIIKILNSEDPESSTSVLPRSVVVPVKIDCPA
jgi:hypothetical protein